MLTSGVVFHDGCPPVGRPEDDNELVYGDSQNLNKIKYENDSKHEEQSSAFQVISK